MHRRKVKMLGEASLHVRPATLSQILQATGDKAGLEDGPKSFGSKSHPF